MVKQTAILGLAAALLLSVTVPVIAADRAVLVELFGGTWCGYCPTSQAALEILREEFTEDQFIPMYYHIGGADPYRTAESQARASYFGVGGVPHVMFDAVDVAIGTQGTAQQTANWYRPKIEARLAVPSPIVIRSEGFIEETSGWVTAVLKAVDTVSFTNMRAQFVLYEEGLSYGGSDYAWTVRDMLPAESVTLSAPGDSVEITRNFTVNDGWEHKSLRLVVFLENTSPKEVVNAQIMPDRYNLQFTTDHFAEEIDYFGEAVYTTVLHNLGAVTDTVTMDIAQDELPDGVSEWDWFAVYCDTTGTCYFGPWDFVLEPGAVETFYVHMTDYLGNVQGRAVTSLSAKSNGDTTVTLRASYGTFVDLPSILIVDDDDGESYETYLAEALADTGYPGMVWDADSRGRPSPVLLESFWGVFWTTAGGDATYVTAQDEQNMSDYLDADGNLFLASADFLSSHSGPTTFMTDYLHIDSWIDDVGGFSIEGVPGDPISHDMTLGLTGGPIPTAGIDSFVVGAGGNVMFEATSSTRGVRAEGDGHKVVFISFPFEDVKVAEPAPNNQKTLVRRIVEWFQAETGIEEGLEPEFAKLTLRQNHPNPFNPTTTIHFVVPTGAERVELAIYNVNGRVVRSLVDDELASGPRSIVWDGTDDGGRAVSSGIYFARLRAGSEASLRKMTLLK